jgi:hypothetical protein
MSDPKGMPFVRRRVNRWMSKRISELAGVSLPDSQCGFRLMHLKTWNQLIVAASHFEIESEMLMAFARAGCAIEFTPIEVIYKTEQSKIHPVRDTVRWVKWWSRVRRGDLSRRSEKLKTLEALEIPCSTSSIEQPTSNNSPGRMLTAR